jgi:NitT/TauT family transport system permease protein
MTAVTVAADGAALTEERRAEERRRRHRRVVLALRVVVLAVLLGGWELATETGLIDPFFFGQPSGIAAQLGRWLSNGTASGPLWEQVAVTLEETILGFAVGVVLGVFLGVLLGVNRTLAEVFGPYIRVANSIPRIVLAPIFIIWLGLGIESKVATAVVLVFFVVFFNAFQGVREVPRDLISNARILGASQRQLVSNVVLPSALTWITASLHTSFGFAIVGAVVGEFVGATKGLGELIAVAKGAFNPNGVFAAMFILAVVALTAEILMTALERRLLKWRPPSLAEAGAGL